MFAPSSEHAFKVGESPGPNMPYSRDLASNYGRFESFTNGVKSNKSLPYWSIFWRYFIADFLFSYLIVTTAVVGVWRGTWDYSTYYLDQLAFQGEKYKSLIFVFVIGFVGIQFVQTSHFIFKKYTLKQKSKLNYRFNSKLFSLFWGVMDIYFWRGVWETIDYVFLPYTIKPILGSFTLLIGVFALTMTKSFRSSLSLPTGITLDDESNRVYAYTYYETNAESSVFLIIKDSLVSTILEGFVVASWHGIWVLTDVFSYDYLGLSNITVALSSYSMGLGIGIVCLYAQFPFYHTIWANDQKSAFSKYFTNFLFTLISLVSTVWTFRGVWYSYDAFFLTIDRNSSLVLAQLIGLLTLFSINCGSCLHAGIIRDLDEKDGLITPYHYFSYYFFRELTEKDAENEHSNDSKFVS
ncbi:unnamed protein product [Lepeophtheirus salmonis]|uniref:(salmon louse) hypothetical protein n=1 Tax=Lepeophtheirus salmonis TaxID=72036 RepID=A0A7R8CKZ9_LEPSM|nr:unnamed protein product [Lepeophtheirus salmonis]CAF2851655.1 unnamed protein product [Lepeophtheirus salmonis]